MVPISIIRFFINYIFILYLVVDVINLYNSLYNFSQIRDVLTLKKVRITYNWNGGNTFYVNLAKFNVV